MQTLAPAVKNGVFISRVDANTEMTESSQILAQASALPRTAFHASKP